MRIRRFNENVEEISPQRIRDITELLGSLSDLINDKKKNIETIIKELEPFRSKSKKTNDQIDDTIILLQTVNSQFIKSIDGLDNSINSLDNYTEKGRDFLYSDK